MCVYNYMYVHIYIYIHGDYIQYDIMDMNIDYVDYIW